MNKPNNHEQIFTQLNFMAQMSPSPFYWIGLDGKCLGVNQKGLDAIGAPNKEYVLGKTLFEVYKNKEVAEMLQSDIDEIIRTGRGSHREDSIIDITTGKIRNYAAIRVPLLDHEGNIIGITGTSIEIIMKKETEQLKMENLLYQEKLKSKELLANCLKNVQNILQITQHEVVNEDRGLSSYPITNSQIKLTKREKEVIYYLSLNKSPKEIASILAKKENKQLSPLTISSIIDKQLYVKFNVYSVSALIEKAVLLNLIPFLLE